MQKSHTHTERHTQGGESDTHMNELLSHVCACLAFIEKYLQLVGSGALFQAVFEAWFGNFSNMLAIATFYASCVRVCVCELSHLGQAVSDCDLWSALFAVIWLENPTKRKRHKATTSQPPTCHTPFSSPPPLHSPCYHCHMSLWFIFNHLSVIHQLLRRTPVPFQPQITFQRRI